MLNLFDDIIRTILLIHRAYEPNREINFVFCDTK